MAIGPILLAGGALFALAKSLGGNKAPPTCPTGLVFDTNTGRCTPVAGAAGAQPQQQGGSDTGKILSASIGIATQVAGAIVTAAGGGGVGTAGAGAAVGGKTGAVAAGSVSVGTVSGLVVEAIGGSLIIIGIIAAIATVMIANAIEDFRLAVEAFVRGTSTPSPRAFYQQFTAKMSEYTQRTISNPNTPGYAMNVKLPSATLQEVVRTSLFLSIWAAKTANDARRDFLAHFGWDAARQLGAPIFPVYQDYWTESIIPKECRTGKAMKDVVWDLNCTSATNCDYNVVTAPVSSLDELQSAALKLLGDNYQPLVSMLEFQGKCAAIAYAVTSIYTQGFYPGDTKFVTDIRDTVVPNWQVVEGDFWATNKELVHAVWLVDPVTGNRVAPAEVRARWKMVVSVKGMPVSAGVFAGFAGRRIVSRRQFSDAAGGVAQDECVDPATGNIVGCQSTVYVTAQSQAAHAAAAKAEMRFHPTGGGQAVTRPASGGSGSSILPIALLAGGALLLKSGALHAIGFGDAPRRKRRR